MTEDKINQLAKGLTELEPGFLPLPLFVQLTRLTATPIVEIVPLRQINGLVQVLLFRRGANDPAFASKLHTPGTVIRSTDQSFTTSIERVCNDELTGVQVSPPTFVSAFLHKSERGTEVSQVYWVEVKGNETNNGEWHNANNLPPDLVASQLDFIPTAVKHYSDTINTTGASR